MHYSTLVIATQEGKENIEEVVQRVLASGQDRWWDWWQIGGRWTGAFDGYDPDDDPVLKDKWGRTLWPTQFPRRPGDIIPVESLTQEHIDKFYHVVVEEWGHFARERWIPWHGPDERPSEPLTMPPLSWLKEVGKGGVAVVVDVHN